MLELGTTTGFGPICLTVALIALALGVSVFSAGQR